MPGGYSTSKVFEETCFGYRVETWKDNKRVNGLRRVRAQIRQASEGSGIKLPVCKTMKRIKNLSGIPICILVDD